MRKEQSALAETRMPSRWESKVRSRTESSWPLSSPSFSPVIVLKILIVPSSEAT